MILIDVVEMIQVFLFHFLKPLGMSGMRLFRCFLTLFHLVFSPFNELIKKHEEYRILFELNAGFEWIMKSLINQHIYFCFKYL